MQKKQRFVADQRVDLPHIERMLNFIEQEFNAYNRAFSPFNIIFKNWKIEDNGGLSVRVNNIDDSLLFDTEKVGKEGVVFRKAGDPILSLTLANNAVNYVELQVESITEGPQIVALWDDNAKVEYAQVVDTCYHEEPKLVSNTIGFTSDPDKLKLAIVTTSGGVITVISDQRDAAFHVSAPWDFGVPRSDFGIESVKDSFDALATSIQELKGTGDWYDAPTTNLKLLKEYQNIFYTGGGTIQWEGAHGAGNLGWSGTIQIEVAGRPTMYTIVPAAIGLADGQCIYVDIPETPPLSPLLPLVANFASLSLISAAGKTLQVLFLRRGAIIYGMMDIPELTSGEQAVIGQDLSTVNRTRLGITGENTFEAYSSTRIVAANDTHPAAISKLDNMIPAATIWEYAGAAAPAGWLLCDGTLYPQATYPALFAALGGGSSPFGVSGPDFNVPDKRGRVAIGAGAGPGLTPRVLGAIPGGETLPVHNHGPGTLQTSGQSVNHTHSGSTGGQTVNANRDGEEAGNGLSYIVTGGNGGAPFGVGTIPGNTAHSHAFSTGSESADHGHTVSSGVTGDAGAGSHGVIQPSVVMNFIIKT